LVLIARLADDWQMERIENTDSSSLPRNFREGSLGPVDSPPAVWDRPAGTVCRPDCAHNADADYTVERQNRAKACPSRSTTEALRSAPFLSLTFLEMMPSESLRQGRSMPERKEIIFFNSLPRSGSTLLANILAQNPRFYATHTSGLVDVLYGLRNGWDSLIAHKAHPLPNAKRNVLRAILYAYYEDIPQPVVFDKSRGWVSHLEMVEELIGKKAKVLICIRDIPDILASLEKLNRDTSRLSQPPGEGQNYFQFQSQPGRCEHWLDRNNILGTAYDRIVDVVQRGFRDRLHFVHFNQLTSQPVETLKKIYGFLGESYYEHNFQKIEQVTQEDDALHGYSNLHTIKSKLESKPSDAETILGEELVEEYSKLNLTDVLDLSEDQ
jgi:sulfotransferase